jgi:hypothetical protein
MNARSWPGVNGGRRACRGRWGGHAVRGGDARGRTTRSGDPHRHGVGALGRGRPRRGGRPGRASRPAARAGSSTDHVGASTLARRPDSTTETLSATGMGRDREPGNTPGRGGVLTDRTCCLPPGETPLERGVWTAATFTRNLTSRLSGQIQGTDGLGCPLVQRACDWSTLRSPGHEEPNEPVSDPAARLAGAGRRRAMSRSGGRALGDPPLAQRSSGEGVCQAVVRTLSDVVRTGWPVVLARPGTRPFRRTSCRAPRRPTGGGRRSCGRGSRRGGRRR